MRRGVVTGVLWVVAVPLIGASIPFDSFAQTCSGPGDILIPALSGVPETCVSSPDVAIVDNGYQQTENSVFVHPLYPNVVLNANNSYRPEPCPFYQYPLFCPLGADHFVSIDGGQTWQGSTEGVNGENQGDPTTAIDRRGRIYVGYMLGLQGLHQHVSHSEDVGATFARHSTTLGGDRPHLWVDNAPTSPRSGSLYNGSNFGGSSVERSVNGALSWQFEGLISSGRVLNLQTAPNGDVYALTYVEEEGGSRSLVLNRRDPLLNAWNGNDWLIQSDVLTGPLGGSKAMKAGLHSMTVGPTVNRDVDAGDLPWTIYVAWPNRDPDGDWDVYMIRSKDGGTTWSPRLRVNGELEIDGVEVPRDQWMPWIAADPTNGDIVCIFYDSRDSVDNSLAHTYVALSRDGGETWADFRVSDADGPWAADLPSGHDYIGIDVLAGKVYPVWSDTRAQPAWGLAYVSPFELPPRNATDRDEDGIPDDGGSAPCATGQSANCDDNCPSHPNPSQVDRDGDGRGDHCDNCFKAANNAGANPQVDGDFDGFGNYCDADFDQSGVVDSADQVVLQACFGHAVGTPGGLAQDPECRESDLNGDGSVGSADFQRYLQLDDNAPVRSGYDDVDVDGVPNDHDDCVVAANGTVNPDAGGNAQLDADVDGFGNFCDGDFDQSLVVDSADQVVLQACFGHAVGTPGGPAQDPECRESDLNGDGSVGSADFQRLNKLVAIAWKGPGPSGLACAGVSPCPAP